MVNAWVEILVSNQRVKVINYFSLITDYCQRIDYSENDFYAKKVNFELVNKDKVSYFNYWVNYKMEVPLNCIPIIDRLVH